jgi:hypothetical protein
MEEALEPKVPLLCVYGADSPAEAQEVRARLGSGRARSGVPGAVTVQVKPSISGPDSAAQGHDAGGGSTTNGATGGSQDRGRERRVPSVSALTKLMLGDLRARLSERGLATDGLKKELVARLREAMVAEAAAAEGAPPASPAGKTAAAVLLSPAGDAAAARTMGTHLVVELPGAVQLCSTALNSPAVNSLSADAEDQGGEPGAASGASAVRGTVVGVEEEADADGLAGQGMVEGSEEVPLTDESFDATELGLNDALLVIEGWLTAHLHASAPLVDGAAGRGRAKGVASGRAEEEDEEEEEPSSVDARAMETAEAPPARSEELRRPRAAGGLADDD